MYQRIRRPSSSNSSTQSNRSQFAPPPIKVQAKQDTETPAKQEESLSQSNHNFANIPTLRPDAPTAEPFQPQGLIQLFRDGSKQKSQQETSEIASYERMNLVQRTFYGRMPPNNSFSPIQAKLTIGQPGDKYEQEADRVASQVVQQINSPASTQSPQGQSVQRQELEEEEIQAKPEITSLQRQELPEKEKLQAKFPLHRQEAIGGGEASTDLTSAINSARGRGQPLDADLQQSMGQAMGADFSGVKVHTDSQSDQLNQSIQAKAFTTGQDLFFRQGEYQPRSHGGQELIAHELTHVVQQGISTNRLRKSQTLAGKFTTANPVTLSVEQGIVQRYIEINDLFPTLKQLNLTNDQRHNVMLWNARGTFDKFKNNVTELKKSISEHADRQPEVGELAPGQLHKQDKLPNWLGYFSEFTTKLPNDWGVLSFKKSFDRMTENGWISDNAILPKDVFPKGVAVHVILAVKDIQASEKQVTIKPHVTFRVKEVQDKYDQIALLTEAKLKSKETKTLGLEGTQNSLSIGTRSVRAKENTNANENIGKSIKDLENIFTFDWLENIVKDAWAATTIVRPPTHTEKFVCDGAASQLKPIVPKVEDKLPKPNDQAFHEKAIEKAIQPKTTKGLNTKELKNAQKKVNQKTQKPEKGTTETIKINNKISTQVEQNTGLRLKVGSVLGLIFLLYILKTLCLTGDRA